MPALTNPRQERFCQLVKRGIPRWRAYPMAGYKPDNGAPYRLSENVRVKGRIAELTRHIAVKTRVTVESLTAELDEARELAARVDQPSAMTAATIAKGKLHGLLVERKESGNPGDFAALADNEAIIARVRAEMGDDMATALAVLIGKAEQRDQVEQAEPSPTDIEPASGTTH